MKVIIPVGEKSMSVPVCLSFGRAPCFALYDTDTGKHEFLDNAAASSQGGAGIRAAQTLADCGASALITFRCGKNAADVLTAAGISMYKAQDGSVEAQIAKLKNGQLQQLSEIHPGFHSHGG